MPRSSRTMLRVMVDFPAPDGEERIRRSPRRFRIDIPLLHVLDLLAELLDHGLQFEAEPRQGDVVRLGADRVCLAAELLREEVEATTNRSAVSEEGARRLHVSAEPVELLADVGAGCDEHRLLV